MIRLNGITWTNPRGYLPLVAASAFWNRISPRVSVSWEQFPWYQFEERVLQSLAQQDGRYDLIMFDHPWTGQLAGENWLTPWNDLVSPEYIHQLRERVVQPSVESYELDSQLWALPLDSACHAGLFRSDLVSRAALPSTWEEIASWAKEHHNPPNRYPLVLSLEGVLGHCLFLSMMSGLGFPAYLNPEDPACDRTAAEHVLVTLRSLLPYTPPGSTRWGPWDIFERFVSADDILFSPSIFAYVNYFGGSGRSSQLKIHAVPNFANGGRGRPILGGVGLGVARCCAAQKEAAAFGVYLMSEAVQSQIFPSNSGQPSTRSVWDSPEINASSGDFYHDLLPSMTAAYTRPTYKSFHALELFNGRVLQPWWDGQATLGETLTALRAR